MILALLFVSVFTVECGYDISLNLVRSQFLAIALFG